MLLKPYIQYVVSLYIIMQPCAVAFGQRRVSRINLAMGFQHKSREFHNARKRLRYKAKRVF